MTNEEFEALVERLERQARAEPERYRRRVLLLSVLGNAYVGAVLLLMLALLAASFASLLVLKAIAVKLILVIGVFIWMVLKALWVRIDPPEGVAVGAGEAPALFAMIDQLRRRLGAPRFHHVLIDDEFNAAVMQLPRLGLFGWPRNYLLIGLPLMKSLTVEQFKAVLAHEFGHLAKGHGRVSNWVYRQRLRWSRLLAVLEANESGGSFLFAPFLRWFAPYFNAYSFPMARTNEYEADATSARLTSSRAAAEALTNINVVVGYLGERYWPQIQRLAEQQPTPAYAPYRAMGQRLTRELDPDSGQAWLDQALARRTDTADTHPALGDRLKALGESPRLALPGAGQTAEGLLGGALETVTARLDQRWTEQIQPAWEAHFHEVQEGRRRLGELEARVEEGASLTVAEAFERAMLTESVDHRPEEAIAQLRALHARAPEEGQVCLSLGARLLQGEAAEGIALVEQAMALDEDAITAGCELLRDYHFRNGREAEAHAWHRRLEERQALEADAHRERNRISLRDLFQPHGLDEEAVADLRRQLKAIRGLRRAYLVRKQLRHLAHRPCYVFGFGVTRFFQLHSKRRAAAVLARIQEQVAFPGETIIFNYEGDNASFVRKLKRIRRSRLL